MDTGTIIQPKYFNGVATSKESIEYQSNLVQYFKHVGMLAFGQMPFIAKIGPDPEKDYDWRNIDCLLDFAKKHDIRVHYNTVINSHKNSFPDWYYELSAEEKKKALERHIKAIVGRYKDRIEFYKLVNESNPYEEENFLGTNETKTDLIVQMFAWAKEVHPEGEFIVNDHFPFLQQDKIRTNFISLIKRLKEKGAQIDAIGIEGHLGYKPVPFQIPSDDDFDTTIEDVYNSTGLPIYITEFDISYNNAPVNPYPGSVIDPNNPFEANGVTYANWFDYQAYAYKHFYELCKKKEFIKRLYFWGFSDKDWYKWERPSVGFFDENFKPKPVFNEMQEILNAHTK